MMKKKLLVLEREWTTPVKIGDAIRQLENIKGAYGPEAEITWDYTFPGDVVRMEVYAEKDSNI